MAMTPLGATQVPGGFPGTVGDRVFARVPQVIFAQKVG